MINSNLSKYTGVNRMCYRNKFAVSYGLIVITKDNRVMLIKRKVPYCVQNFYIFLNEQGIKHNSYDQNPWNRLQDFFENECLPYLSENDQLDYFRFKNGKIFEDMYDYPHGQMSISKFPKNRLQCFQNAYREFREETGFRFSCSEEDIDKLPLKQVKFKGCDQHEYTQYYFIVMNVKDLRRHRYFDSFTQPYTSTVKIKSWKDDRLVYKSYLIPVEDAFKILKAQQSIKKDDKHLILKILKKSNYKTFCLKHMYHNWRCLTCCEEHKSC